MIFPRITFGDGEVGMLVLNRGFIEKGDTKRQQLIIQISESMKQKGLVKPEEIGLDTYFQLGALTYDDHDKDVQVEFVIRDFPPDYIVWLSPRQIIIISDINGRETEFMNHNQVAWLQEKIDLLKRLKILSKQRNVLQRENDQLKNNLPQWVRDQLVVTTMLKRQTPTEEEQDVDSGTDTG